MNRIVLFFLFATSVVFSQDIIIEGIVVNEDLKELEYVNIGIKNKQLGTITDENGNFNLLLNKSNIKDTLTFSYIGFKEFNVIIEALLGKQNKIILKEEPTKLTEVVVLTSKTKKTKKIGTKSYSSMVAGYVRKDNDKNNDIQEFAKKIKLKKPSKLLNVNMNLFYVEVDSATFRINVYSIKNELPFKKINTENIIVRQKIKDGWNEFDLSQFNLVFDTPIFISLEFLPKFIGNKEEPFRYSGQLFGKSITRSSSLGEWNIKRGLSMSIYVTVEQ